MRENSLQVVDDLDAAAAMLTPLRLELLGLLREPNSATGLSKLLDQPRQKVNYHLRALETAGLVELVEERPRRNFRERIVRATAASYLVSPELLGSLGANPQEVQDRFSSGYLLALLSEGLSDVSFLRRKARLAGKKLATLSLQTEIRFASPEQRNQFATELARFLAELTSRYHDESSGDGRTFKFVVSGYPAITDPELLREKEELNRQYSQKPQKEE
jgi:DNA-binding transcriptional ArsR family regulator